MIHTLDEWITALPLLERERVDARAAEPIAEEVSRRDLRKAMRSRRRRSRLSDS